MPTGYPDYERPVSIDEQRVAEQDINIYGQDLDWIDSRVGTMPSERVEYTAADQTDDVPSGETDRVTIYAPSGYLYDLKGVRLFAYSVDGATSGTHAFQLISQAGGVGIMEGASAYSDQLEYDFEVWKTATDHANPSTDASQVLSPRGMRFDENNALIIDYVNNTDSDQVDDRTIRVWFRKIKVS